MKDPGRLLILGAGPTGLGVATRLSEVGLDDYLLLEGRDRPGGLAASHVDDAGFTWDLGGHVHHSHYRQYDELLDTVLPDGWLEHERAALIRFGDRWVPYPFQLNLHRLAPPDRDACLEGLAAAAASPWVPPETFGEWVHRSFGAVISERFMIPYNEKVWGCSLEEMGTGWMGDRVARPDIERIKASIAEDRDSVQWGPNRYFRFPRSGGTGALWRAVANRLPEGRLRLGALVRSVDLDQSTATLEDGRVFRWDRLLSTIPLDRLCALCEGLPEPLQRLSQGLVGSAVHVLGIGLRGTQPQALAGAADPTRASWLYFPGENSPYYRVTLFSNYSPSHVPTPDCWSLMAEVCESSRRPVDEATLQRWTLKALREDGLLSDSPEVVSWWHRREAHGYPTPFLGRDELLSTLLPALEGYGVYSRGRFGAWKYEVSNQDHCFMQGVEVVDRLLGLGQEVTLHHPEVVNRG